jgi:hypothetical protein
VVVVVVLVGSVPRGLTRVLVLHRALVLHQVHHENHHLVPFLLFLTYKILSFSFLFLRKIMN